MAALLPLLASPCVTSVPHAYSYSPHVSWVCVGRRVHDVHLLHGGHVLECRCVESVPAAPLGVLSRANGPLRGAAAGV